jgi:hypothetical protein
MRTRRWFAAGLVLSVILVTCLATVGGGALARGVRGVERVLTRASGRGGEPSLLAGDVGCAIDRRARAHPINPHIYGVAGADPASLAGLGATLNRWGGNPSSRYNWVIGHAWNTAADYRFLNVDYGGQSGSASDAGVAANRAQHVDTLITIPALGWVAKSDNTLDRSVEVPDDGGPAVDQAGRIAGYDPSANRERTSVRSLPRKPGPFVVDPDPASPVVYEDEWVNHLVARFGRADAGGVRLYAVDNEPMLWSTTHRDVHPARMGYDDLARVFEDYSSAIKAVDPSALVVGPESWGYLDLLYSALDRGDDNFATDADRRAHGDVPLVPWFLRTIHRHDVAAGRRTLDVVTVHWYPQGLGAADRSDPDTDALRLRSTQSLWDPAYVDESWIQDTVRLIPRLREWVAQEYPGTGIGITEYNFGGGDSISAGLAEAEALGIFGREDLSLATYWTSPKPGSPAWFAFRMYRDDDGRGAHFGETSIAADSSAPETVSCFASRERGWIDVMLINKDLDQGHLVTVDMAGHRGGGAVQRFEYSGAAPHSIVRLPDMSVGDEGTQLSARLPTASITLLRVPARD